MPKPGKGESQKDYISRFISDPEMVRKYPEDKQRREVAMSQWEGKLELKMDIAEIRNVEIMDVMEVYPMTGGKVSVKESDLDEIIENFNRGILEPVLNLDHNDGFSSKIQKALDVVALGFVSRLWKNGTKLIADFKEVPAKVAELIQGGALKKRSVEWYRNNYKVDGQIFNNVLKGVSFFGADAPAIHTLNDNFEVIYDVLLQMDDYKMSKDENSPEKIIFPEEKKMATIEIEKSEYENLVAMKSKAQDYDNLKAENESLKSGNEDELKSLKTKVSEVEKENADLKEFKQDVEKNAKANLKKDAESFVDDKIKETKILPKYKDRYVSDYLRVSENEKELEEFKQEIEDRAPLDLLKDNPTGGLIQRPNKQSGPLKTKSGLEFKDDNALNDHLEKLSKEKSITWEKACEIVGV